VQRREVPDDSTHGRRGGEGARAARAAGLRVKVVGGGCSGFQYQMYFDEQVDELDHQVDAGAVRLLIDPMSVQYLKGVEIDYLDGLQESGFKIHNPNAQAECGCGKSFGA